MTQAAFSVALLGAESTGKTQLSQQLAQRLRAEAGTAVVVPEYLRQWCEEHQRTPHRHEQAAIAQEQAARVESAAPAQWLIADTTPLMVAVYSDLIFGDRSLHDAALLHQRRYHLTLLMGLDLPWVADAMRDGPHATQPVDARVRSALAGAGMAFQVVYGHGKARTDNAMNAINMIAAHARQMRASGTFDSKNTVWAHVCATCGDAQCEHRLFRRLV